MRRVPPLPRSAPVVIVGGGVIGVSAAFHLAEAGVEAVLLERAELGSGSTSRAAGGIRAQFSDPLNIAIAQRSLGAFQAFAERPGWEIDFEQVGYLFVLSREADVAAFERNVSLQREHGVTVSIVSPVEAKRLCPLLAGDDILAAAYSPSDGHATPEAVVQGYASAARALGAHIRTHCAVSGIELSGGRITGIETSDGAIATDTVLCTAGVWSPTVGRMVGIELPISPLRRQILVTEPLDGLPRPLPMTIDFSSSFYFHREGPGLLLGMSDPDERPGFSTEPTDDWIPRLAEVVERRAPAIAAAGIRTGWAGLYEMTPDRNALIGEAPAVSRFLYAAGFSGHGFLQGPAIGEILRDLVLGREPPVDVSVLSADRFAGAALRPEIAVV